MAKTIKVGINGFGRIGRAFFKEALRRPELEIAAINELGDVANLAYLLKYDTVYGRTQIYADRKTQIVAEAGKDGTQYLVVDGRRVLFLSEKDPANLPWGKIGVDVVVEATGHFVTYAAANTHLAAGAKRVVITAPMKGESRTNADLTQIDAEKGETVLMGINEEKLKTCQISSNASCTTNAGSPLLAILDETIGVEKAVLNTVHGYTASQSLVDGPNKKDFREGRAAAENIVPSSTGAAIATTKALTGLAGKFDGISIRVPVVVGSIVDVTFIAKRETSAEEVNQILKKAAGEARWQGIFTVTEESLVSRDIVGDPHASIADLSFTRVVGGNLVKVLAWYDNEMGYTHTLVAHVIKAGQQV